LMIFGNAFSKNADANGANVGTDKSSA